MTEPKSPSAESIADARRWLELQPVRIDEGAPLLAAKIEAAFAAGQRSGLERAQKLEAALREGRTLMHHRDFCEYVAHAGWEYGEDSEALERDHPCNCGGDSIFRVVDEALAAAAEPGGVRIDLERLSDIGPE